MRFDRSIKIAPSLLTADFAGFGRECAALREQGCDWLHIDVMDGHVVPNITFGPDVGRDPSARKDGNGRAPDDHPGGPIHRGIRRGRRGRDQRACRGRAARHRTLQAIRAAGVQAGVAPNPGTPAEAAACLLDAVDLVCAMSVTPGFGGQTFLHPQVEKVRALRAAIGDRPIHLEVDGGLDAETAPLVAGAGVLVAGSAVFKGGSAQEPAAYGRNMRAIREAAASATRTAARE